MSESSQSEKDWDLEYSPSRWCRRMGPDDGIKDYLKRTGEESEKFSKGSGFTALLDQPYGSKDRERVDIYIPQMVEKDAPVFMFIHGGYWQVEELSKNNCSLFAQPLISRGAVVVVVGYCLAAQCTISEMVKQVQQATLLVARKFPETRGIYISGHSAGGHLSAMMLSVDWSSCMAGGRNLIKGICPVSGVFDLRPLVKTYVNIKPLSLTESSAAEISPILFVESIPECNLGIRVRLPYGEYDPPTFHKQSQDYCKRLTARGMDATYTMIEGRDHFDEVLELPDESCVLQQVFRELMAL